MIRVEQEDPRLRPIQALFCDADAASLLLYPGEERIGPTAAFLVAAEVRFFAAWREGAIVGCGGYVPVADGVAELKRLFVAAAARGFGVGRVLLDAAEDLARREGFSRMRLETGFRAASALALYRAAGFAEAAPFGPHAADPSSRFMEKSLGPARPMG